jgi:hypothetical protein
MVFPDGGMDTTLIIDVPLICCLGLHAKTVAAPASGVPRPGMCPAAEEDLAAGTALLVCGEAAGTGGAAVEEI